MTFVMRAIIAVGVGVGAVVVGVIVDAVVHLFSCLARGVSRG